MKGFRFKQWTLTANEADEKYNICNLGPNGEKQFYEIVNGKYGEPIIVAEPEYAFDPPASLMYLDAKFEPTKPDQKIAGIVCQFGPRLSLTNAKKQGVVIKANGDGSIQVGDEQWWVATLFLKDKNRIRNYDAFCVRVKPNYIRILELGDINLF